jgi:hypothetical protein
MSEDIMSHEFDDLDAIEKAGIEAALNRCRALSAEIASALRSKTPEHFVDKLSLADFYTSLEHAADVLGQKGQRAVETKPAPVVKGSQTRHRFAQSSGDLLPPSPPAEVGGRHITEDP